MARAKRLAKRARSYADIEEEAYAVSVGLGYSGDRPIRGVELFESLGGYGAGDSEQIPLEYHVEDLPLGVEAETRFIQNNGLGVIEIVLGSKTYDCLEGQQPRARFSLAHEIGHAALHTVELIEGALSRAQEPAVVDEDIPAYMDMEWQANAFASALLMPAMALVKLDTAGRLCVEVVCEDFGVSKTSARIRLDIFAKKRNQLIHRIAQGKKIHGV